MGLPRRKFGEPRRLRSCAYDPVRHPLLAAWAAGPRTGAKEIAARIGIPQFLYWRWLKEHREFAEAVEQGRRLNDAKVIESLYRRAVGYEFEQTEVTASKNDKRVKKTRRQMPPDVKAAIFWLKNRLPDQWREKPPPAEPETIVVRMRPVGAGKPKVPSQNEVAAAEKPEAPNQTGEPMPKPE